MINYVVNINLMPLHFFCKLEIFLGHKVIFGHKEWMPVNDKQ